MHECGYAQSVPAQNTCVCFRARCHGGTCQAREDRRRRAEEVVQKTAVASSAVPAPTPSYAIAPGVVTEVTTAAQFNGLLAAAGDAVVRANGGGALITGAPHPLIGKHGPLPT